MTEPALEFMRRLDAIPGQRVALAHQPVDYPEGCPSALPGDMIWPIWWTRVIGPVPTMAMLYLQHLVSNRASLVSLSQVAEAFHAPVEVEDPSSAFSLHRFHWAISQCALHRLIGLASIEARGELEPSSVLILPNRIPRPGRAGFDAITESFQELTGEATDG